MMFSRHVRNNMRLYGITESDILAVMEAHDHIVIENGKSTALKAFPGRFSEYPIKVVFQKTWEETIIITAYPLKKGARRK